LTGSNSSANGQSYCHSNGNIAHRYTYAGSKGYRNGDPATLCFAWRFSGLPVVCHPVSPLAR
jgi:hypothetical protein